MEKQDKIRLKSVSINGFKSFNAADQFCELNDVSVLIGANGAGKSNFVSFFKMLGYMMNGALQQYIGEQGGANSVLYLGRRHTSKMSAKLEFDNDHSYEFVLTGAAQDAMIFSEENVNTDAKFSFPSGTKESGLHKTNGLLISTLLSKCRVYQFHDTSSTSNIRNSGYINQTEFLYGEGGNLAAFLYGMKENIASLPYYEKIVRRIKQVFPSFRDFALLPSTLNNKYIMLDWVCENSMEYKLGAHQLSDGTLRFMCLSALLLQAPQNLPSIIVLDEPELGLHPSAIVELSSMIKTASQHSQIIVATQSPALLDEFSPEQITVLDCDPVSKSSIFKKFTAEDLCEWLEDYTLSEMWDKNILGGRP